MSASAGNSATNRGRASAEREKPWYSKTGIEACVTPNLRGPLIEVLDRLGVITKWYREERTVLFDQVQQLAEAQEKLALLLEKAASDPRAMN